MATRSPCDLLLVNAHVLTMDERFTVYAPGSIAVRAGQILGVGDIEAQYEPRAIRTPSTGSWSTPGRPPTSWTSCATADGSCASADC